MPDLSSFSHLPKRKAGLASSEPVVGSWRRLVRAIGSLRDLLRSDRHRMVLRPFHDLETQADGSFLSTGPAPQFELNTARGQLPSGWCWISIDVDDDATGMLPQLFTYSDSQAEPDQVMLLPPRSHAAPMLVRLPDVVQRLRLDPDRKLGRTGLQSIEIRQLGKLRLLLDLVRDDPGAAWLAYRSTPSFEHFKIALIEQWGRRHPMGLGLDWMQVYDRGARPSEIAWSGTLTFSVVMPVHKVRANWLAEAVESVAAQTYPQWELICVDDGSCDPAISTVLAAAAKNSAQVRILTRPDRRGVSASTNEGLAAARGDFVVFMDHDDVLEPHALARLADAATQEGADLLYADEIVTGEDSAAFMALQARPAFSHDYYMSHPYVVHPIAVRTTLARAVGGLDESLTISQDVDFVLRVLEQAPVVTHIPDVLYRWRLTRTSAGHRLRGAVMETTAALKAAHLHRLGFPDAVVKPGRSFNTFVATYHDRPQGRVLAVIPTKNQVRLLKQCIDTVRATSEAIRPDVCVIDHQSDDPGTIAYLGDLEREGVFILPYKGPFNFSAMNNAAVDRYGAGYDYFLFLNNDIEAETAGWLDSMVDLAMRPDVGVVGATLLYPDRRVQHAGVVLGMHGAAEHSYKFAPSGDNQGTGSGLHATREYSAVTAACMLVRADAFRTVGGYDDKLEVGFNDTDLCLRIGEAGYRILNCAEAILVHHESASRGKSLSGHDPHPKDSQRFRTRHAHVLDEGDPFFSPLLDLDDPLFSPMPYALRKPRVHYRTSTRVLPIASRPVTVKP